MDKINLPIVLYPIKLNMAPMSYSFVIGIGYHGSKSLNELIFPKLLFAHNSAKFGTWIKMAAFVSFLYLNSLRAAIRRIGVWMDTAEAHNIL